MADLAYLRLEATLLSLAQAGSLPEPEQRVFPGAFLDAWAFVDASNRLRDLVRQMPRMEKSAGLRLFFQRTAPVESMRDVQQHLNNEIAKLAEGQQSVWGSLGWVATLDESGQRSKLCSLVGGQIATGIHPFVNPLGKVLLGPIDHVRLTLGEGTVELTRTHEELGNFVKAVEPSLESAFSGLPRSGSDFFVFAEIAYLTAEDATA